ncbi:hypothetical protein ACOSP7_032056 [Xanthoceras sorbifolium]
MEMDSSLERKVKTHLRNGSAMGHPTQNAFEYEICRSSPYRPVSIPNFEDNKSTAKPKLCNCENRWSVVAAVMSVSRIAAVATIAGAAYSLIAIFSYVRILYCNLPF